MQCQQPFQDSDVIVINPSEEEIDTVRTHMESRRAAAKAKSKSAKRAADSDNNVKNDEKKVEKGKKLKTEHNNETPSIVQKLVKLEDPAYSKVKPTYSVAKDPNASDVFKSLFTSSEKAKKQTKAHWVTYNPFYN